MPSPHSALLDRPQFALRGFATASIALFAALATLWADDLQSEIDAQAAAARAILDPWHAERPRPADRKLHIVYWTPSDREPAKDYRERLTRILKHIQNFYADEMERNGFGRRSLGLREASDGLVEIHLVKGAGPYGDYDVQSGAAIKKECLPTLREAGIDVGRETIVIFCNLGTWDEETKRMTHKSPYYAGGSHISGTAWQLDEPILDTLNLPKQKPRMHDGQYGWMSLGKHNTIFIGGVAHELGHALSLPHNKARPDEAAAFGTALMGSGNHTYYEEVRGEGKGSFLTLAHAMRLASHPQFSGSSKGMVLPASAEWSELSIEPAEGGFRVKGKVAAKIPIYGVVAYTDPEGGSDYNATTYTDVPDADGTFDILCNALVPGKSGELRLLACHANGATSRRAFGYKVDADGTADVSSAQIRLALAPLVAERDPLKARAMLADLPPAARAVADRLLSAARDRSALLEPAAVPGDTKRVPLSDTKPAVAKVGWMRPSYDRLPERSALLAAGGEIFAHGIYAHAPARHAYRLGGKWKSLSGEAGMADGKHGQVAFVIKGDGETLWRSERMKAGSTAGYEIDVSQVETLELVVEDGRDGNGGDWGLWLEPELGR